MLILFLSFQNGQETASTSHEFTKRILQLFMRREPDNNLLMQWDGHFRLAAHFVLFFLYGILGMLAVKEFRERGFLLKGVIPGLGILLAVFSEVGKIPISGRHCDLFEMSLNIIGMVAGILLVLAAGWIYQKAARHSNTD